MPGATVCVPCKIADGDDEKVHRYDGYNDDLEVVAETYFHPSKNPQLSHQIHRLMNPSEALAKRRKDSLQSSNAAFTFMNGKYERTSITTND